MEDLNIDFDSFHKYIKNIMGQDKYRLLYEANYLHKLFKNKSQDDYFNKLKKLYAELKQIHASILVNELAF